MNLSDKSSSIKEDKKLLTKIKQRDQDAFVKAYDLYVDQIYRFIYFKVNNQEEAQDITSAVFLKTWNYIQENSLKNYKTLKALIYKIARNTIIDYYRKKSHITITIDDQENKIDLPDTKQDIIKQTEIFSDFKILEEKLQFLKDEYREVIILRYIDELSINEIADIVNKSKSNIRVLTHRALKALRELMEE